MQFGHVKVNPDLKKDVFVCLYPVVDDFIINGDGCIYVWHHRDCRKESDK